MQTLETRININATPEMVWKELTDFASYPDWNPFVLGVSGNTEVGERIAVKLKMEDSSPQTFKPMVLVKSENHELRWLGRLFVKGLFDGEHYFKIQRTRDGVELLHGEIFKGALVGPVMSLIGKKTESSFHAMNEALKQRVEQKNN